MLIRKKLIVLSNDFDLRFSTFSNLLFIKGAMGTFVVKLSSTFLYLLRFNFLSFLFLDKFFFNSFISHFSYLYSNLYSLHFVRLKARGLGYRIYRICGSFFRLYFGFTNYFYLHSPKDIIVKSRKRRLLLLSNNPSVIKLLLAHLLLLKKISTYRIRGLVYPKQIIILKIGKKDF